MFNIYLYIRLLLLNVRFNVNIFSLQNEALVNLIIPNDSFPTNSVYLVGPNVIRTNLLFVCLRSETGNNIERPR